MVMRIGTKQRKTRYKFRKNYREKGKVSLSRYFQAFNPGERVNLKINSGVVEGRFFPRFQGLSGEITGKKGSCYRVLINDNGKEKTLIVHPIHLKKQ
ncbi:MAG: 50S ribosomal protein L21e [Nanoarchaeota archaeon]